MAVMLAPSAFAADGSRAGLEARIAAGPTLPELAAYALSASPAIRGALAGHKAALGTARAAGWWPDPRLTWEKSVDSGMWKATLAQGIPLPGANGAASDAADAAARAAASELCIVQRDQQIAVADAFWELAYLREAKRLAEGNLELLGQVVSAGDSGFARGRDALAEVLRARSQAAQAEYDSLLLGEMAETETARLNALLDRPAASPIGPLLLPVLSGYAGSPEGIERKAEANCLETQKAEEMVKEAEAMVRGTRYENLPMLEVGGVYEKGGNRSLMASISLPLWFGRNAGRSSAARAGLEKALAGRDEARAMTRAQAREAHFAARNGWRLISLYRDTLLPQAARAMESAQALYRQGAGTYSNMVETTAAWYNFQLTAARARSDYGKALARVEALVSPPGAGIFSGMEAAASTSGLASPQAAALLPSLEPSRGERLLDAPSPFAPVQAAEAGTSLAPTFTLARLQGLAFTSGPTVLAAEKEARGALEAYSQAGALSDLLRRYSAFTGAGQEAGMLYPFPGSISLAGSIVDAEVKVAAARREMARRDAGTAAARAFWNLAYNRAAQGVADAEARRIAQVSSSVSARYKAGEASFADLATTQAAAQRAAAEAAALRAEQGALEAKVREAVGLTPSAPVGAPEVVPPATDDPGLPELERLALARSPDLAMRRAEVERMELMVQMGRRERQPGYSQGLSLNDNRFLEGRGGMSALAAPEAAGMSPAWLRELERNLEAGREQLRRDEAAVASEVRMAWSNFDRARRDSALYETDLASLARLAADSTLRAFETGAGDLARAVDAENEAARAELARERARADLGIARTELIAASGGPWTEAKENRP